MFDPAAASKDANRETSGKLATFIWIASGIYLFATTPHASFFSWQAALFFMVGMFAAAILLGGVFYLVVTALTTSIAKLTGPPPIAPPVAVLISFLGILLLVGQGIAGYLAARLIFNWIVA